MMKRLQVIQNNWHNNWQDWRQPFLRVGGFIILLAMLIILIAPSQVPYLVVEPISSTNWFQDGINTAIGQFVDWAKPFLRAVSGIIDQSVRGLQFGLHHTPWFTSLVLVTWLGWRLSGAGLAMLVAVSIFYMAASGLWLKSMNTLAMVGVAIPLALSFGFLMGVLAAKSKRAGRIIEPSLDLMQTIPTFAYLVPLIVLFGLGPVPGVIASMIYAAPPITRNVILGLNQVPSELKDVAAISGTSRWQSFAMIELPNARQQILVGVNQSILASLSMVIIAAVIGGFDDIGREVLVATNKGSARFGEALSAGLIIVLMAVVIDRLSRAASMTQTQKRTPSQLRQGLMLAGLGVIIGFLAPMDNLIGTTSDLFRVTESTINDQLSQFITSYGIILDSIKNNAFIYVLLPLRIGLEQAVMPMTWGVEFTETGKLFYQMIVIGGFGLLMMRRRLAMAIFVLVAGYIMYRGFTGLPWWAVTGGVCLAALSVSGLRLAIMCFAMLMMITVFGHWADALYSLYLCAAAVLICLVIGCPLGIMAAKSERVSRVMQPINDTLQSIPLYIFLIPAVALFQISEFSALVAIVLYAIVPIIRYTEHGLRSIPVALVEASVAQGCNAWQRLIHIELPVARPSILLGLNQTVLFSLAMLIIAVLVGARGLAEQVNIGLRSGDTGLGLTAGLSMAFIAIMADRILRAWANKLGAED